MSFESESGRMKISFTHLLILGTLLVAGSFRMASAQTPYSQSRSYSFNGSRGGAASPFGQSRPAFSPYLNLLRGGNSTLFNYYGLVRPEQQFRQFNSQTQQSFGQLRSDVRGLQDPRNMYRGSTLQDSGHSVQFFSDLRGGFGSVGASLRSRDKLMQNLQPHPYSRLAPSGHLSWFGNRGSYFPSSGQAGPTR